MPKRKETRAETAKNAYKQAKNVFQTFLGPGDRAFESHYSDQNPSVSMLLLRKRLVLYCAFDGKGVFDKSGFVGGILNGMELC